MAGFRVTAFELKQRDHTLYGFVLNSRKLGKVAYVTPRSRNNPTEVQRILKPDRVKKITAYIDQENSLLPNAIVVDLDETVEIKPTATPGQVTITFPSDTKKVAYVLDGQHRLEGFKDAKSQFDLPVVALHNADEELRIKIFADINSLQVPVTKNTLYSLYQQIHEGDQERNEIMDTITSLNDSPNSPLLRKIKVFDDDSKTWINAAAMVRLLRPLTSDASLLDKTVAQRTAILKAYFEALKRLWPEAWGSSGHNLCTTLGFELLLGVLPEAMARCDLNKGFQYTADNFQAMLKPLVHASFKIQTAPVTLDWQKGGSMAVIGNQYAKNLAVREMKRFLLSADAAMKRAKSA
jgi:DGQHR domain-containing protein